MKLAPTKETIGVLLPKGSLENAAAFADAGLWSKYLDALDKLGAIAPAAILRVRQGHCLCIA